MVWGNISYTTLDLHPKSIPGAEVISEDRRACTAFMFPLFPLTFCSLVSPLISPSQILLRFTSSLLLHLYSECMRNRVHLAVIEGGSNYLTIIMFNAGNTRSDRAQTFLGFMTWFQPFIWRLLKTVKEWVNSLTYSLPGLMLATGDTWPLCFRCLGSSETSRQ